MRSVAFVEFSPSGGLFQFSAQLGEALAERGHRVDLYTGPDPELRSGHAGFRIHPVLPTWHPADHRTPPAIVRKARRGIRALRLVLAWLVLLVRLRRQGPDVVLWSNWPFSLDALGVLLTRRLLPTAVLGMVAHEPRLVRRGGIAVKRGPVLDRALPAAWSRMDVVFVLGEQARTHLLNSWQPAGPVVVIPHGDERALRNGQPVIPVAQSGPVALFFGTWTPYKGIDVLLESWSEVRRQVPAARLVLAGAPADVDLAALLERAAQIGGVEARPGYVPRGELPALLGDARVVVVPYVRATQSGVAHLAYTFERPVVATSVGDIPSVVEDGRTGLLVAPGDPAALAAALVKVLIDADLAARLARCGAERLTVESSWARVAQDVDQALATAYAARVPHG